MPQAEIIAATTTYRVALAAYEERRAAALVEGYTTRTDPVLSALRTLTEAAEEGSLTAAQQREAERLRASLARTMRDTRNTYRDGLQQDLFRAASVSSQQTARTLTAEGLSPSSPSGADLQALLARPVGGSTWFQRLDADLLRVSDRVDAALLAATRRGASMENTARLLRDALGEVEGGAARLRRIARTEIQRVSNDAAQATYRANRDVIRAVRYLATLDSRVCPICQPLHNEEFSLDEQGNHDGPALPQHPHCRCFYAPVTFSLADLARRAG